MSSHRQTAANQCKEAIELQTNEIVLTRNLEGEMDKQDREENQTWLRTHRKEIGLVVIFVVLVGCFTGYFVYTSGINRDMFKTLIEAQSDGNKKSFNVGVRQDFLLQECQENLFKQSFPDIGYSFLGYNMFRGYPLAIGHDPGFTLPIFVADYSEKKQSSDCRYSIPKGLLVLPDVSCELSFSSRVAQTRYEFTKTLSVSANIFGAITGGEWGAAFSASSSYKESSTEISTGDYVYITSSASCNYYFSKLMKRRAPKLHPLFVEWVQRLAATDDKNTYFEFFNTYGTHFSSETVFGARYTFQHRMTSSSFETIKEKSSSSSVEMKASVFGLFSTGRGFGMSTSERSAAMQFSKSVETKTLTVGATPPANGDANTWAANVKTSPVPIKYKLHSIEELFTDNYMTYLNIDKTRVVTNIRNYKSQYCDSLKQAGLLDSCEPLAQGVMLKNTRFLSHYRETRSSYSECVTYCGRHTYCVAITYCVKCAPQSTEYGKCFLFTTNQTANIITRVSTEWQSYIFLDQMQTYLTLPKAIVKGTPRAFDNPADKKSNIYECYQLCVKDITCAAMSFTPSPYRVSACLIYNGHSIYGLTPDNVTNTYFIPPRVRYVKQKAIITTPLP